MITLFKSDERFVSFSRGRTFIFDSMRERNVSGGGGDGGRWPEKGFSSRGTDMPPNGATISGAGSLLAATRCGASVKKSSESWKGSA